MSGHSLCDHCERVLTSKAYRVVSEDSAGVLLDEIVCDQCHLKAQELGLETREIDLHELLRREQS